MPFNHVDLCHVFVHLIILIFFLTNKTFISGLTMYFSSRYPWSCRSPLSTLLIPVALPASFWSFTQMEFHWSTSALGCHHLHWNQGAHFNCRGSMACVRVERAKFIGIQHVQLHTALSSKGPCISLMFCCHHLEILNLWTRGPHFPSALSPANHVNQSWCWGRGGHPGKASRRKWHLRKSMKKMTSKPCPSLTYLMNFNLACGTQGKGHLL